MTAHERAMDVAFRFGGLSPNLVEGIAAALLAAEQEAERGTVQEAARAVCGHCADGKPLRFDPEWQQYDHVKVPAGRVFRACMASALYRRWPAYAPGEGNG